MGDTSIQWTDKTWNPVTGCTEVSPGCDRCYAKVMAKRLQAMGQAHYANGFEVTEHEDFLDLPRTWKKPQRVFVNSMSDLFHKDVSTGFILDVFSTMIETNWHTYQVLTKRPSRLTNTGLLEILLSFMAHKGLDGWPRHIWLGVSVENQEYAWRIDKLRQVPAPIRFVSYEPALGRLTAELTGIQWLIAGGESGSGARPISLDWFREVRDHCETSNTAFFMKQMGIAYMREHFPSDAHKDTHGGDMQYFPGDLRIREYPKIESPIAVGGNV